MTLLTEIWTFLRENRESLVALTGIVSSLLAVAGLTVSARAMMRQAKAHDASGYLDVVHRIAEGQRKMRAAQTDSEREFEANEFLNLLEGLAQLYLHHRYGRSTREMVRDLLIETLAFVDTSAAAKRTFVNAITSGTTFAALGKFRDKHRKAISRQRQPVAPGS